MQRITVVGNGLAVLEARGHRPERMRPEALRRRFPTSNADLYPDGFFHAAGA